LSKSAAELQSFLNTATAHYDLWITSAQAGIAPSEGMLAYVLRHEAKFNAYRRTFRKEFIARPHLALFFNIMVDRNETLQILLRSELAAFAQRRAYLTPRFLDAGPPPSPVHAST
jgi:uncharacterized protein YeaO (DUF488 family)